MAFVGPSYPLSSRVASVERAVNLVPVPIESPNAARRIGYRDVPGLTLKATLGGAIRGALRTNGRSFVVAGSSVLELDSSYATASRGTVGGSGWCDFASNQTQIAVTDGTSLYVMARSGSTFGLVSGYPGGDRIDVLNEYLLYIDRDTGRFGWSNVGDASVLDALDFATAESSPDNLTAVIVTNGEVLLLGTDSGEIWHNVGGDEVFVRNNSATIEVGTQSPFTVRRLDNSVFWVGSSEQFGQGLVYRLNGYTPVRISNRWVEEQLAGLDLSGAYAFTIQFEGHSWYVLQVPGLSTTLVYDVLTGLWHEWAELVDGDYEPHRADAHLFHGADHVVGDSDGRLYKFDSDVSSNAGDELCRSRVLPNITSPDGKLIRFAELECICDKATGGTMLLRWSNDNGATWGSWHQISLGDTGNYKARARKLALGSSRNRVFELRVTDAVKWNPVDVIIRTA